MSQGQPAGAWRREPETVVLQGNPLPEGAPVAFVILAESHLAGLPHEWEPHLHPVHELVWVRGGTLTAQIGGQMFTVSDGTGLWIPAETVHSGRLTAGVVLCDAYFDPAQIPIAFGGPTVISITPLLESLLAHLTRPELSVEARARAEAVVFDALEPAAQQLSLALPGDPRIDRIAETLLADPADPRSLEDWAKQLDVSDRTITRAFRGSTGLSFSQWRQTLRIHRALALLAGGNDVQETSDALGYTQPSTFIAAFRRVLGITPGAFIGQLQRSTQV